MWIIFKVFTEFVKMLLLLYVLRVFFFGLEACGILSPQPETKLAPPAMEGEVLTMGPPGKSSPYSLQDKGQAWDLLAPSASPSSFFLTLKFSRYLENLASLLWTLTHATA